MTKRYATVIVLAEDERSANLLRRYAERALDVNKRRIRQEISPSAKGDAKEWILNRYPIEVKEVRRLLSHMCLLVHLDADVDTVMRRSDQLAEALRKEGIQPRQHDERISHIIPRRHTETWLCALTGIAVNEDQDCKRQRQPQEPDKAVKPAVEHLFAITRPNASQPSLPSLIIAVTELRRLEK